MLSKSIETCFTLILDTDECLKGSQKCHVNAACNNSRGTGGGDNCSCKDGYIGDGLGAALIEEGQPTACASKALAPT